MGLIRDALGSALGANEVKNGFNGPQLPFVNRNYSSRSTRSTRSTRSSKSASPPALPPRLRSPSIHAPPHQAFYDEGHLLPPEEPAYRMRQTLRPSPPPSYDKQSYANASQSDMHHITRQDHITPQDSLQTRAYRPLILPQIAYGEGQPFLRGYSIELEQYGISSDKFLEILDAINVAIIPNPEVQIFQKGANIAGWFIPGSASLGLMAGQFGVGIANAFGHSSMINRVLSKANLEVFLPEGLEICIGKTKDVDAEVGSPAMSARPGDATNSSAEDKIAAYGNSVARVSEALPPLEKTGRTDPIAAVGKFVGRSDEQRKLRRAEKRMSRGKSERMNNLEGGMQWLMVRQASPAARAHWQQIQEAAAAEDESARQPSQGER